MTKNKDKQIRELKKDRDFWRTIGIVFTICFLLLGISTIIFNQSDEVRDLKQDLESCRDKVPEINKMQRVCCYFFDKIQVCWDTELYFDKKIPENCEVIE